MLGISTNFEFKILNLESLYLVVINYHFISFSTIQYLYVEFNTELKSMSFEGFWCEKNECRETFGAPL